MEFPSGPVIKTPPPMQGTRVSIPGQGIKILYALQNGQ